MVHVTPTLSDVDAYLEAYYVANDVKRTGWDESSQPDQTVYLNQANAAISVLKGLKYDEVFSMNAQIEEALELATPSEDTKRWEQRNVQSYSLGSLSESFRSVGALQELHSSMAQAWAKRMMGVVTLLSNYFSQTVVWEQKIGIDDYSKPIKGDAVEIKARKQTKERRVLDKDGAEVVASLTAYTNEPVQVEDYIDGRCVISVWPMYAPNGDIVGYEVLA